VRITPWLTTLLAGGLALVMLAWLVRQIEPRLAFFPIAGEDVTPADAGVPFRAETIGTADGERLRLWHLAHDAPRARIVYFHGNGGNLSMWSDVFVGLWHEGFDVVAFDYRGYGLSSGDPSETGLYRDADAVLTFVHDRAPLRGLPLIYWGRSLGTAVAAYAASVRPPDGIVLEAGFPSVRSVLETNPLMWMLSWVSSYRFPTADWMASVRRPALVLHGDRDGVIPYRLGQRLHAGLPGPKTFVTIRGGDHNDPAPAERGAYWDHVRAFVTTVSHAAAK
jgi:fermentation-respiration switch protein FrsA (DUF1100 family)